MSSASIVIPCLNEATEVEACLLQLQPFRRAGVEVIVVDGGSVDATLTVSEALADRCILAKPGRAVQMNSGALCAQGELLFFLHVDTRLPEDFLQLLAALPVDTFFWGRFDVRLSGRHWAFRLIEKAMNMRSRCSGVATGDQVIFMSKKIYQYVDGFPEIALMEDVAMSKQLRRIVGPLCCRQQVVTSSRRWEQHGIVQTVVKMWCLRLAYCLGVNPLWLAKLYG